MIVFLIRQASLDVREPCFRDSYLPNRERLLSKQLQFLSDVFTAHLRIADRGLNGWHAAFGNMSQVIGDLFQAPARCPRSVSKVVTETRGSRYC